MLDERPESQSSQPAPRLNLDSRADRERAVGAPTPETHVLDYVRIVYKRRRTVVTVFLVVVIATVVKTFTAVPIYEATTRLLIEAENPNVISFKEVISQDQAQQAYYQTQYNMLQSRSLAKKTLQQLRMLPAAASRTDENSAVPERQQVLSPTLLTKLRRAIGMTASADVDEKLPEAPAPDETAVEANAIDGFLQSLTVTPVKNSRLVDIEYSSPIRELPALILNTHAKAFIEQNLEYKFMSSKEATDWLGERLTEQRGQVEKAQLALQRYREQNDAVSLEERQNIVVQKLVDLNTAVTRAKTQRIEKQSLYNELRAAQSNPAVVDSFPAILSNTFIQQIKSDLAALQRQQGQLSENLGERHPDIVRIQSAIHVAEARLQGEIGKVVESVRSEYLAALAQEKGLMEALETQKAEALLLNRKGIDYGVLQRDAESSKQIYDSLLQRVKETGVSGELKTSNIRIIDQAEVPRSPVGAPAWRNLTLSLFGGAVLGLGFAFFFEYLDNRVKTAEEIQTHLGLPFLGMVPLVSPRGVEPDALVLTNGVPANFSEAFRYLRTNVLFSSADDGSKSVVVTSTGPGEGKTIIAANLAVGFAQAGQRVLMMDADLRRPKIHELFGLEQEPGLSNLIISGVKASDVVRKSAVAGLWILSAGRTPPNPAEILGSRRFREFLVTLREHFDWVIIDSPPVMPVADASIVANIASGVVFVIGAEMTSRGAAQAAIEQLDAARSNFLGAVLNRVDLVRNRYYYANRYSPKYSSYYTRSQQV